MNKPAFIVIVVTLVISIINCYSQGKKTYNLECGYQFKNDMLYFVGLGAKIRYPLNSKLIDYYDIHISQYFEDYMNPDNLKKNYALTSRVAYEFKFLSMALSGRYINMLRMISGGNINYVLAPEFGIGYKYVWLIYSRDFLLCKEEDFIISPHNFKVAVNIPLFDKKL